MLLLDSSLSPNANPSNISKLGYFLFYHSNNCLFFYNAFIKSQKVRGTKTNRVRIFSTQEINVSWLRYFPYLSHSIFRHNLILHKFLWGRKTKLKNYWMFTQTRSHRRNIFVMLNKHFQIWYDTFHGDLICHIPAAFFRVADH